MIYENFKWNSELTEEFYRVVLDNYEFINDVDEAMIMFIKLKLDERR